MSVLLLNANRTASPPHAARRSLGGRGGDADGGTLWPEGGALAGAGSAARYGRVTAGGYVVYSIQSMHVAEHLYFVGLYPKSVAHRKSVVSNPQGLAKK